MILKLNTVCFAVDDTSGHVMFQNLAFSISEEHEKQFSGGQNCMEFLWFW